MTDSEELKARLQAGIRELEADIVKLRAALRALEHAENDQRGAGRPAAASSRRRRHGDGARGQGARGASQQVVPAGKLTQLLRSSDGLSTAELAAQADGSADQVLALLKELERAGKAHRTGVRRSTRWHAGAEQDGADQRAQDKAESDSRRREAEDKLASALESVVAS
jgi:hypothetical protein